MKCGKAALLVTILGVVTSTGLAHRELLAPVPAPSSCTTVAQTAQDAGLTTLLAAATAANLAAKLSDPTLTYTVFAPTNTAFSELATNLNVTADELLKSSELAPILENHLLAYPLTAQDLLTAGVVKTQYEFAPLNITSEDIGNEVLVRVSSPVDTANVVKADIVACKSIVHIIDQVLVPEIGSASS